VSLSFVRFSHKNSMKKPSLRSSMLLVLTGLMIYNFSTRYFISTKQAWTIRFVFEFPV
jgi:hypothetical protein